MYIYDAIGDSLVVPNPPNAGTLLRTVPQAPHAAVTSSHGIIFFATVMNSNVNV